MQFKELHRNHLSKAKLAKCFPGTDEAHNTCASVLTHVAHTICLCSKVTGFWKNFSTIISEILETETIPCSFTAVFDVALYYPELKHELFYHLPLCLPVDVSSCGGRLLEDQFNLFFLKLEILNFLFEDQLRNITPNGSLFFTCGKRLTVLFIQPRTYCDTLSIL